MTEHLPSLEWIRASIRFILSSAVRNAAATDYTEATRDRPRSEKPELMFKIWDKESEISPEPSPPALRRPPCWIYSSRRQSDVTRRLALTAPAYYIISLNDLIILYPKFGDLCSNFRKHRNKKKLSFYFLFVCLFIPLYTYMHIYPRTCLN